MITSKACVSRSSAQNEARDACGRVTVLFDIGPNLFQAHLDGAGNVGAGFVDRSRPLLREALRFKLGIELVTIELGRGAVRFNPQVELQVEITVVVLAELYQRPGEVHVVADGAIVTRGEPKEREPTVGEEPLLGAGARETLGAMRGAHLDFTGAVKREPMVEQAPRTIVGWHRDPASFDLIFPAGASELLFAIEDPCSHDGLRPFAEWIAAGDAHPARVHSSSRRNLSNHNQPRRSDR